MKTIPLSDKELCQAHREAIDMLEDALEELADALRAIMESEEKLRERGLDL
jgi:hypothetical protein